MFLIITTLFINFEFCNNDTMGDKTLEKASDKMKSDSLDKKGQASGGTIQFVVGIVVLVIVVAVVAIPVVNDSIDSSNVSGTDATILGVTTTLLAVLIIVMIANVM